MVRKVKDHVRCKKGMEGRPWQTVVQSRMGEGSNGNQWIPRLPVSLVLPIGTVVAKF